MSDGEATAILIAGVHRSGTSALARVLLLHGAELGGESPPGDIFNAGGYWENREVVALHERLLAELGSSWRSLAPLPQGWPAAPPARRFAGELRALLAGLLDRRRPLLVKDPRLAVLAPIWIEVLESLGARPRFAIAVRHPDEVAASLHRRDGMSRAWARLLWLRHMIEVERATRGRARVFVHYERLLADWRREHGRLTRTLDVAWPRGGAEVERAVDASLDATRRHHRGAAGELPEALAQLYARLEAAAEGTSLEGVPAPAGLEAALPAIAELERTIAAERARGRASLLALARARGPRAPAGPPLPLQFHVDQPEEGARLVEVPLRVSGWAFLPDGQTPPICVRAGGEVVAADGAFRPDVAAAFPEREGIARCGFEAVLRLAAGRHEVAIEAWLGGDAWLRLAARTVEVTRGP